MPPGPIIPKPSSTQTLHKYILQVGRSHSDRLSGYHHLYDAH
ncbi:unnamed protein product [Fusarium venenatum]|uniref:Uncharacterized protein n=1 Tax=Fusarium venenatum TaxID=56646 RepID=A0A2L2TAD3_9HYPO|nr:uncharacterized protein FVRRES_03500 [Fusarium venenatum]CEI66988.1 unnamed protein product [Fusarium venenatum]